MAKFCTGCGAEVDDQAVVCPKCGIALAAGSGSGEGSYFDGTVLGWIGHAILFGLLLLIPFVGFAFSICNMGKWIASHTYVDGKQLEFTGAAGGLFGSLIIWELLTIVTLGIYGFWVPTKVLKWVASHLTFAA